MYKLDRVIVGGNSNVIGYVVKNESGNSFITKTQALKLARDGCIEGIKVASNSLRGADSQVNIKDFPRENIADYLIRTRYNQPGDESVYRVDTTKVYSEEFLQKIVERYDMKSKIVSLGYEMKFKIHGGRVYIYEVVPRGGFGGVIHIPDFIFGNWYEPEVYVTDWGTVDVLIRSPFKDLKLSNIPVSILPPQIQVISSTCTNTPQAKITGGEGLIDLRGFFSQFSILGNYLDLTEFKPLRPLTMARMFHETTVSSVKFGDMNTSSVVDMSGMFEGAYIPNLDLSKFDTSSCLVFSSMFNGYNSLFSKKNYEIDISNFDFTKARLLNSMFKSCDGMTAVNLGDFNTVNCEDFRSMFAKCTDLSNIKVNGPIKLDSMLEHRGFADKASETVTEFYNNSGMKEVKKPRGKAKKSPSVSC